MRFRNLNIFLHDILVGELWQFGEGPTATTRFAPAKSYWQKPGVPLLSWATVVPQGQAAFWQMSDVQPFFNSVGTSLPPFFHNMLPEGALRRHLAEIRKCPVDDHFEIFAACGTDLPGAVYAFPGDTSRETVSRIVTQNNDALEMSVTAEPMAEATSLSGLQAKLSLVEQGGRYVARTKDAGGIHIIGKLPTADRARLPEVEELSLRLAASAGVNTCTARLAPMTAIDTDVPFDVDEKARNFLAVVRFDRRNGTEHVHCEDFAQILGVPPEMKYHQPGLSYALMAQTLQDMGDGEAQVSEFLRRLTVNEMLGNYDAHAKNFGVVYEDGHTPRLSPAYDVVAYAAYQAGQGHAMKFAAGVKERRLSPAVLRAFCNECGFPETLAATVVRQTARAAVDAWPDLIAASELTEPQKKRLLTHFHAVPMVAGLVKRMSRRSPSAAAPAP